MHYSPFQSAGAGQLSPKLTVKIQSQVWSTSWTRIAASRAFTTGSFPAAQFDSLQQPVVTANNVPIPIVRDLEHLTPCSRSNMPEQTFRLRPLLQKTERSCVMIPKFN